MQLIIATEKRALHARMSHSTVCNMTVSTKKAHTGEISTPVTCNAACVQEKHSCKREGKIRVCASNQAWAWVWVCVCVCHHQTNLQYTATCVCVCV